MALEFSGRQIIFIPSGHYMTKMHQTPNLSSLAQTITRDGKTVRVDIYGDGEGGWLLEVVDEHGNSTVWDDPFASDREALAEALSTIDEDGIDSLIGLPSGTQKAKDLNQPLSRAELNELNELNEFLADESIEEMSMDVSTLEGFLTAIVIGPRAVHLPACQPAWWSRAARISPGRAESGCVGSPWRAKSRPQRSLSLWQWQEVQEVLRSGRRCGPFALRCEVKTPRRLSVSSLRSPARTSTSLPPTNQR